MNKYNTINGTQIVNAEAELEEGLDPVDYEAYNKIALEIRHMFLTELSQSENNKVYSLDEIKNRVQALAIKYMNNEIKSLMDYWSDVEDS